MHQRRKDQFRHHLQDRSQFQLTCRLCCDPTYWRLLTTKLIDELNQDCSGKSILSPGGIEEWSETRSCWKGSPCRDGRCDYRHGLANKKLTMKKIRAVVENLPKDLNFKIWCFLYHLSNRSQSTCHCWHRRTRMASPNPLLCFLYGGPASVRCSCLNSTCISSWNHRSYLFCPIGALINFCVFILSQKPSRTLVWLGIRCIPLQTNE